ncbi:hypothetical protein ACIPLC_25450 [Kitasatospora sp. NPDC086801]|uniref:hypothetical protein n=1 Tax=Kitasatospora sp. NPDC086801 TaxID=3364066 RepID=UPI00381E6880
MLPTSIGTVFARLLWRLLPLFFQGRMMLRAAGMTGDLSLRWLVVLERARAGTRDAGYPLSVVQGVAGRASSGAGVAAEGGAAGRDGRVVS